MNFSAKPVFSNVVQKEYNARHATLSHVNAAETKHKGLAKGHTSKTMN